MAFRFYNEEYGRHPEQKAHMSIMDGDKAVEIPIVRGVIKIPDNLMGKVVLPPGWTKYVGQVPTNDEELQPIEDVDFHYTGKKGGTKAANSRSNKQQDEKSPADDKKDQPDDKKDEDQKQ